MYVPNFPEKLTINEPSYAKYLDTYLTSFLNYDKDSRVSKELLSSAGLFNANIVAREPGVFCGSEELTYLLDKFNELDFDIKFGDGDLFSKGDVLVEIKSNLQLILELERLVLNLLSRLCGIATETRKYVKILSEFENEVALLSTRKALLPPLDKKAAVIGGAYSHRLSLSHALMIKDNHKEALGLNSILKAINSTDYSELDFIEFEIESEEEAQRCLEWLSNNDLSVPVGLMFDNFLPDQLNDLLKRLSADFDLMKYFIEASGGIRLDSLKSYDIPNLNFVSCGSITKDSQAIDLSLELESK